VRDSAAWCVATGAAEGCLFPAYPMLIPCLPPAYSMLTPCLLPSPAPFFLTSLSHTRQRPSAPVSVPPPNAGHIIHSANVCAVTGTFKQQHVSKRLKRAQQPAAAVPICQGVLLHHRRLPRGADEQREAHVVRWGRLGRQTCRLKPNAGSHPRREFWPFWYVDMNAFNGAACPPSSTVHVPRLQPDQLQCSAPCCV